MINIVVPMAGRGSRFSKAGYTLPKPLLPVFGRPMIEVVIENLRPAQPHRFIFICQREHLDAQDLEQGMFQPNRMRLLSLATILAHDAQWGSAIG